MSPAPSHAGTVELRDVGKRYVKYDDTPLLLTRALRFRAGGRRSDLWAVRHVDLSVQPGETVGVIGRNGAGKSTMLRMLAGVTAPTEGSVVVHGRVAPLIAVGVGFHPELTGRENVYVNATVLGLRRKEIDRLFDSIVDFSEIERFIDTPVKFYSSGMFVRLGFSVAVASRPDVLLVDEVLAVGDLAFQQKCFDRMEEIRNDGTSVIVVSHNLNAVRQLCERTMVLQHGNVAFHGETDQAISVYHDLIAVPVAESETEGNTGGPVRIRSLVMRGANGDQTNHVQFGESLTFEMEVGFEGTVVEPLFQFLLSNDKNQIVYSDHARDDFRRLRFEAGETARFLVTIPAALRTGSYKAWGGLKWPVGDKEDHTAHAVSFFVSGRPLVRGVADLNGSLTVQGGTVVAGSSDGKQSEEDWADGELGTDILGRP